MNRFKTIILIFVLTFSLYSCTDNKEKRKEIVAEKIAQFSDKKAEWNKLRNRILANQFVNSNLGKGIYPSDLEQSLSTELIKKGIKFITVCNDSDCKKVEYATGWTEYPIGTLNLTWTTCDPKQTEKGFSTEYGFIEVFGIGNNWLIVVDSDFI
ncbi:hypothetical protein BTO06_15805 [Tenacibaculum sp. SZ-18]|uniref:hypothetical protein n=1 Tax=Tenacibaculum sp. SZ-18 TaxID=754423 RepID=UPI000C2D36BF|nr:hypothetical protein [Tenacibaculum sp. SZ-18]AUC16524.1 hypothetical protein BTO06_15805 [Tenacibaculum sp. SZ-18]